MYDVQTLLVNYVYGAIRCVQVSFPPLLAGKGNIHLEFQFWKAH
jgi:hypothetical protein